MLFTKADLRRLIIPLVLEQFLAVAMGFVDTVMVSAVGQSAISGVSLVDTINVLLVNIFAALATGGAVVTAQYLGKKDLENAGKAAKQLLYTVLTVSLIIAAIALVLRRSMLELIFSGVEPQVMEYADIYFLITAMSFPFLALYNGSAALMRTIGNSKAALYTSFIMNLVNVAGNALLIHGFHMGVKGAAISTLLCRMAGAIVMLILLKKPHPLLRINGLFKLVWDGAMVRRILRIGVPTGLENSLFQLGKIIIQSLVATLGTAVIAANAVGNTLSGVMTIPGSAIGLAMITVVGRCVGAREYDQARKYTKLLMTIAYISMGIFTLLIILLLPGILQGIFNLDAAAYSIAYEILLVYGIVSIFIWPTSFALPNALRAAGDAKFTMMTSIISMAAFRVALSYLFVLVFDMNILGVWIAMMIDWAVRSAAFVYRFLSGKWREKQVL